MSGGSVVTQKQAVGTFCWYWWPSQGFGPKQMVSIIWRLTRRRILIPIRLVKDKEEQERGPTLLGLGHQLRGHHVAAQSGEVNSLESEHLDYSPETSSQAWGEETQGLRVRWKYVLLTLSGCVG